MGNKTSRAASIPYASPSPTYARASPYGRPSASLYSASAISRTENPNYGAPSPAERGMLYSKTKNTTPAPTPTGLYSKKPKTNEKPAPTPTSLYSKPTNKTPVPTPTSLYSKKSKSTMARGFSRSSLSMSRSGVSRSGASMSGVSYGRPSPYARSGISMSGSRSAATPNNAHARTAITSCVKCRMPFGDSKAAFCRDCGHPRPAEVVPCPNAQWANNNNSSFGKQAMAF